jgi:DNA-binding phage protein
METNKFQQSTSPDLLPDWQEVQQALRKAVRSVRGGYSALGESFGISRQRARNLIESGSEPKYSTVVSCLRWLASIGKPMW